MSHSEQQYVRYFRGGGGMGTERGQSTKESEKTSAQNTDLNVVSVSYLVLQLLRVTAAVCSTERTTPHDAAPQNEGQGTARHGIALRCAPELYIAVLN